MHDFESCAFNQALPPLRGERGESLPVPRRAVKGANEFFRGCTPEGRTYTARASLQQGERALRRKPQHRPRGQPRPHAPNRHRRGQHPQDGSPRPHQSASCTHVGHAPFHERNAIHCVRVTHGIAPPAPLPPVLSVRIQHTIGRSHATSRSAECRSSHAPQGSRRGPPARR